MKRVYKYPLILTDVQTVKLPATAVILTAQVQHGTLCIWALVEDGDEKSVDIPIRIAGTGHGIEGNWRYINSVQLQEGYLVFHVFEGVRS